MQMDLRTVTISPQRQTYGHVARHLGEDKAASRYQEGTIGLQTTGNQHYRPVWDPDHEYFDASRTAVQMADWYAFRDPRQYYYGSYVLARAKQQDAAEAAFDFVETRGLVATLPEDIRTAALEILLPLRHVAWGSSMNNDSIAAYGYGTALTQPALYYAMDQLGIAQFNTRIGLLLADPQALDVAKASWLEDVRWQSLRRLVEDLFVESDWFELMVAQNFVLDGLLYPLVYQTIIDDTFAQNGGAAVAMVTQFQNEWAVETQKWTDAQLKVACAESAENRALIAGWITKWKARSASALLPIAQCALGDQAESALDEVCEQLVKRAQKVGAVA